MLLLYLNHWHCRGTIVDGIELTQLSNSQAAMKGESTVISVDYQRWYTDIVHLKGGLRLRAWSGRLRFAAASYGLRVQYSTV
jgi:hypothetical protein